jgi:hypothetical protein
MMSGLFPALRDKILDISGLVLGKQVCYNKKY